MIDSEIISNRRNHIWQCGHSLDGDSLQLQNGGCPSDVAQSYSTSSDRTNVYDRWCKHFVHNRCEAGSKESSLLLGSIFKTVLQFCLHINGSLPVKISRVVRQNID